eukprot:TRINITY_DN109_c0_g1_i2.p2 TRINITY_DN109_c0_g1~~TRINITY_DN109_c0_g1_i2.p2  ORF type:complete len:119 (-),score=63.29 TRINITY_DN109_c0_g1_i2:263-619(-)
MKYVAAYLLAVLGGNATPSASDISKILSSVGIEVDNARLDSLITELKGKNLQELIEAGRGKLSAVPAGGASAGAAPAAGGSAPAAAAAGGAPAKKEEPKKEEKKEESEEEDMGFGLFD